MVKIEEYMFLDRETRRLHLDLSSKCIEIGGNSKEFKGLLAYFLGTTIPTNMKSVYLCHACNVPGCSNPKHLYWGTPKDNAIDQIENGTLTNIADRVRNKYSDEGYRKILADAGRKGGSSPSKMNWNKEKSLQTLKIYEEKYKQVIIDFDKSKRGWKTKLSKELSISHTHLNRLLKKLQLV